MGAERQTYTNMENNFRKPGVRPQLAFMPDLKIVTDMHYALVY